MRMSSWCALLVIMVTSPGCVSCEECDCAESCTREYWLGPSEWQAEEDRLVIANRSDRGTDCTIDQVAPVLPDGVLTVIGTVSRPADGQPRSLHLLGFFGGDVRAQRCGGTPSFDSAAAVQEALLDDGDEVCVADELHWAWRCVTESCAI